MASPELVSLETVAGVFPQEDSGGDRDNARLMKALKALAYHGLLLSVKHPVALVMQYTRQQVRP